MKTKVEISDEAIDAFALKYLAEALALTEGIRKALEPIVELAILGSLIREDD